jgi:glycosyltransferase involved in cell wall biosynthesis
MTEPVSIVIPAFNEEAGVGPVVEDLRRTFQDAGIQAEVIVVDDGSRDNTAAAACAAGARVVRHRSNRGYGAALKSGITAAKYDIIAITDADGTYPCDVLPHLVQELENADMVVGARTGTHVRIPWVRRPAKWVLNRLADYVTSSKIPDLNSGLRVFRRAMAVQYFPILPDAFSFTSTITLAMRCDKYAITYVPIDYRRRTGKSKIVPWDAGSFAILILRTAMLFRPLRVFVPLVLLCMTYGAVKMTVDIIRDPNISASAMLAWMSALIILLIGMVGDALATRLGRLNQNPAIGIETKQIIVMASKQELKVKSPTP